MRRNFLRVFTAFAWLAISSAPHAQTAASFPNKPIKLIVPYPAGGAADVIARIVADALSQRYRQPVIVDNRPGAGGHIGAEYVLQQPADGYTLMLATIAHNGAYKMYRNLRYSPAVDIPPLALIAESPNVLLVRKDLPVNTVPELLALARAEPGKLNYGSAGTGSATHMAAELFKYMTKTDIVSIPFRGGAPALAALLGGQVDLTFETGSTALQAIKSGRVRALAVTSAKRSSTYPELPALSEFLPGYEAVPWYTLSAHKETPPDIVAKLTSDISDAVRSHELASRWNMLGVIPLGGTREDALRRNAIETQRWTTVIDSANIQIE